MLRYALAHLNVIAPCFHLGKGLVLEHVLQRLAVNALCLVLS